ncbi:hypothetical protein [Streptomyces sp. SID13726]|uniref:hypothetical protein n=1 Tax=Streptomyces sp. SID13726 TaxID=2706058 RepID=UPI001EF195A3|nr:hypothetical protein [Streptomyces sp. SID13726]
MWLSLVLLVASVSALNLDRLGRRDVLVVDTVAFGAASLAASFTDSTGTLVVWRAIMGLSAP